MLSILHFTLDTSDILIIIKIVECHGYVRSGAYMSDWLYILGTVAIKMLQNYTVYSLCDWMLTDSMNVCNHISVSKGFKCINEFNVWVCICMYVCGLAPIIVRMVKFFYVYNGLQVYLSQIVEYQNITLKLEEAVGICSFSIWSLFLDNGIVEEKCSKELLIRFSMLHHGSG